MAIANTSSSDLDLKRLQDGLLEGDRFILSKAITLAESSREDDRKRAEKLIEQILPQTGQSIRLGITGAPGAGKSTFIEAFGKFLTSQNKKTAVLTIDPSSQKTKGSILGDKTRMDELSKDPLAFIRPTASGNMPGGVANGTRESILLCEAAGYEVIIVETVGVGQSEVAVRSMVDFFLLLLLPGSGDELQGIKKGIMEMADGIVITKSDGENIKKSTQAQADFKHALHLFQAPESGWQPRVLTSSALAKTGIKETWEMVEAYTQFTKSQGFFQAQRNHQQIDWFHASLDSLIKKKILGQSENSMLALEKGILAGELSPSKAARKILEGLH